MLVLFAYLFRPGIDLNEQNQLVTQAVNQYPSILSVVDALAQEGTISPDTAEIYHALWGK
ncbi:hypothetical protein A3I57_01575 [Candidatus Beckwithbacteria bacterium RIFCSPLOWO2_02_FULL_47_23]|uniref:Uncharacterized protein n=2 Tax=Candidatus Beckwithiibacteriota TaxID=1752726 RepID=A0A1F5DR97_9BACT|nr:MAG: hypothetical protein A3E73_02305 [Candidatus Beckwithbacteria bacterium RIFCSPHIGHO2_12_FULL_47_17]OGD57652.1 MAG: hypothetical protein A3I57_01575 [Candidatus Beckwithbacteria bacterium RIFCSPLOWO2_02_FULL_47_23]